MTNQSVVEVDDRPSVGQRCKAKSSRTGQPCRRYPSHGTTVCAMHGGRAPHVRAAAKRRLAVKDALKSVDLFGAPDSADALSVLQREIGNMSGFTLALERFLAEVSADDALTGEARGVLDLYRASQSQLVKVAAGAISLGLEARNGLVVQRVTEVVGRLLRDLTNEASLTGPQIAAMSSTIARSMRELASTLTLELAQ